MGCSLPFGEKCSASRRNTLRNSPREPSSQMKQSLLWRGDATSRRTIVRSGGSCMLVRSRQVVVSGVWEGMFLTLPECSPLCGSWRI